MDSVLSVVQKRSWHSSQLEEQIKAWLSLLLTLVDITSKDVELYLKDFLTTKSGGVTKHFREHIKRTVCCYCVIQATYSPAECIIISFFLENSGAYHVCLYNT